MPSHRLWLQMHGRRRLKTFRFTMQDQWLYFNFNCNKENTSEIELKLANRPHAVIDVQLVCYFVIVVGWSSRFANFRCFLEKWFWWNKFIVTLDINLCRQTVKRRKVWFDRNLQIHCLSYKLRVGLIWNFAHYIQCAFLWNCEKINNIVHVMELKNNRKIG